MKHGDIQRKERPVKYKGDRPRLEKTNKGKERERKNATLREGDHELGLEERLVRGEGERHRKRKCGRKGRIAGREVRWERNMGRKGGCLEREETERCEKGKKGMRRTRKTGK